MSTLRSSAAVSAAVLASRILGVIRESLLNALFGPGALTDAYVVAFRIPNLLRDLFAEGVLSSAFVPTFTEALARGRERAFYLANLVTGGVLLVTGLIALLGILEADVVVALIAPAFGRDGGKMAAAVLFAQVMMPILTLVSVAAVWMGMLNAQQRYVAPAFAPALFNVVNIGVGAGLWISGRHDATAMLIWSAGTTAAGLAQAVAQLPALWRLGYRPRIALRGLLSDPGVRRIVRLMGPACIGLAALQINVFVNTQFATELGDGPTTYLNNAFRLFYLPVGLFGVALATVTTAQASVEAARGDRAALVERVGEGASAVWLLALPSAVGLVVLAEPVVAVIYEYRRFRPEDTRAMVPIVQAYMLGVLPYSLVKVYSPAFYAADRPRVPMLASVTAVAANLAFNALTYRRLGAAGIALGTTIAALVNLLILRLAFRRVIGRPAGRGGLGGLLAANALLGALVAGAWYGAGLLLAGVRSAGLPVAPVRAALVSLVIGLGFVAYVAAARALGVPAAAELAQLPRRLARKLRR